ncbi:soluble lytic murein transglycosylase-like protein [Methylobacterium sp. PvP062]|uniref:Soluble lytic murein transglycosylase-like protein n=2 Tax=Methylobacterium TaxID=407 RepID=A0ABV2NCE6_9HYPH|nr:MULTISPECIES: transglycosylase SLT domain-containing protein [Methylobacterium]MCX7333528.1 transglycosylase SLT domain-containing protein [Hyphomicrobiales bacterium]AYO83221.1 lytic transglycosylase domain-containing protein [Methylobacterium brachiatum]MBP2492598.1 soluble lytic murein transglycosylase-like protein [Methylobacterium sp. PvP105]MBP2501030.1 soluble lytic murein transglycosylase-like protein [Methylobacterium sp. PvP109]MDQ0440560.1 soluble lytic murein transglycosylase-li
MEAGRPRPSPAATPRALGVLLGLAAVAVATTAAEGAGGTAGSVATGLAAADPAGGGPDAYGELLAREAAARGVPPALAEAVAFVESGYDAGAVGKVGELGLMQVRPATAAMLGHRGPAAELLDPATNVRYGVTYLARAWSLAGGNVCRALAKYRAGHGEERLTPRSVDYCRRARARLAAMGSPLAATAGPGIPRTSASRSGAASTAVALLVNRFWAAHVARVRTVEIRTARIMGGG